MRNRFTIFGLFIFIISFSLMAQTPSDGATGVQVGSVAFSWTAYSFDGTTTTNDFYKFRLGTSTGTYNVTEDSLVYTGNTYDYSLNTESQQYFWIVEAWDDSVLVSTSSEWDFTLGTLDLATPSDASVAIALGNQAFDWGDYSFESDGTAEDDYYVVNIGTTTGASDFYSTTASTVTSSTETIDLSTATNNTQYFWSVDVYDDGVKVFDFEEFDYTTEIGAPVITAPLDNTFDNPLTTTISWTQTGSAAGISYDLDYHSGGGYPGTTVSSVTSPALLGPLTYNTTYNIRIHALKGAEDVLSGDTTFTTLLATPSITAPASGSEVSSYTPTFSWTMAGNTSNVEYEIFVSTSGAGGPFSSLVSGLTSTSYTPTSDLNSSTQYHWYVVASVTSGSNSDTQSSTDNFYTPLGLDSPVNGLTGVSIEPEFTWEDANYDAGGYTLRISTDGSNQAGFDAGVFVTETLAADVNTYDFVETHLSGNIPLDNDSLYYWQVIANDGATDHYSPIWHFTTTQGVDVTLDYPNGLTGVTTLTTTTFTWHYPQAPGNLKFLVQVKASTTTPTATEWLTAEFADTTYMSSSTSAYTITFQLVGGLEYYWRVVVLNSSDQVFSYSPVGNFDTDGGVATPVPSAPVDGSNVYTNTPLFYWYVMQVPVDLTYEIQVDDTDNTFGSLVIDETGITDLYYFPTAALSPGTTHYWRVRSIYLAGTANADTSAWCTTQSFTTQGDGTLVVPVPSYPINNMTVYSTAPFLFWYATNGGVGLMYDIVYDTTLPLDDTPDVDDETDMVTQLSGLTPGETYYWKVRSDNGTSQSAYSAIDSFQVAGGILGGYPIASFPISDATIVYTTQPTILWYLEGSFLGLTGYELRWKAGSNSTNWNSDYDDSKVISDPYEFTYTFETELTNDESYYWAVASTDGSGYSAWSEGAFTVYDGTTITAPILSYPTNGFEIFTDNTTLIWLLNASITGVQGYEVVYSQSDVFEESVTTTIPATDVPGLSVLIENLTPGATYYWKVRTWYGGSTYSSYSSTDYFVVNGGAAAVQPMVGGPTRVSINTLDPIFTWYLPTQTTTNMSYELVVSESEDMSSPVAVRSADSQQQQIVDLENDKRYYWRVRSKSEGGEYSYYSNTGTFTTNYAVTSVEDEEALPERFEVSQNYPNPFNPTTTIKVSIPEASELKVTVYDLLGRVVTELVNEYKEAGVYNINWKAQSDNGNKASSGIYFYKVEAAGNTVVKKMLLLK